MTTTAAGGAAALPAEGQVDERAAATVAPAEFRRAMAEFATGVTVVTGLDDAEPMGFACQSFASVSLQPPLVMFCADQRGRSWPRIRRGGRFCVHVLGEDQTALCERFGSGYGRKFDGVEWSLSRWDTPVLPGVLMRVHADVQQVHAAGDHDLVVGQVLQVERITGRRPMIFFRGGFGIGAELPGEAGDTSSRE
ncbi:flavin reductase family protein [Pseudonocardia aurantiaca]|uniref:Flavin reductase family protein n=1 Tax=Pseudonocardia aurantiaca TaxID=75290 RepID=A0ABW4FQI3_9PSEU